MLSTFRNAVLAAGVIGATVTLSACASASGTGATAGGPHVVAQSGFAGNGTPPPALPTVTGAFGDDPSVAPGRGDPPAQATIGFVSVGTGEKVTRGVRPFVRYTETDWKTGTVRHDSWRDGTAQEKLPTDGANIAYSSFLNAIELGSRVEIVNPTGTGDADVFVVDLIAQGDSATQSPSASTSS